MTSENISDFFQKNVASFVIAGLIAVCAVIYGQSYNFQFINFDDPLYVYENQQVLSGLNADSIRWAFTTFHSANWHPLTWLSLMLDGSLFGATPGGYHLMSVVFHIANSILAFVVFRKYTGDLWKSAMVAFLFAVHPAHVESVAWISERKDVLSTLFWLLTMWAYFKYAVKQRTAIHEKHSTRKKEITRAEDRGQIYYLLTIVFLACGLMAKPMLVTLPFVLLLMDFWTLNRLKTKKDFSALVVEKIPLFVLSAVSGFVTIMAQSASGAVQTLETLPIATRLLNAAVAYVKYIGMVFYPLDLGVSYPYQQTLPLWQTFGAVILLIAVTAVCLRQWNKRKYLLTGWLWFLGTLVPVIGIVQVGSQALADRYTYVPYFGLFIMLVWGASELFARFELHRYVPVAAASILLTMLSILCFMQVSFWKTNETLYSHTIAVKQANFLVMHNYCNSLLEENRLEEAWQQCLNAIADQPRHANSYNTLAIISARFGKYENAVAIYKKALELDPQNLFAYRNLAFSLMRTGKIDEAVINLDKAFELHRQAGTNPLALATAYNTVAEAYAKQEKYDKSSELLARTLQLAPERTDIRANYALSLFYENKLDDARREIEQTIRQNPAQAESYHMLGMILLKQGSRSTAARQFEKALEMKPDYKEAQENLKKARGEN